MYQSESKAVVDVRPFDKDPIAEILSIDKSCSVKHEPHCCPVKSQRQQACCKKDFGLRFRDADESAMMADNLGQNPREEWKD